MAGSSRSRNSIGSGSLLIGSLLLLLLLSSPACDSEWKGMLEPFDHGLPLPVELLDALGLSGLGIPERNGHGTDLLVFLEQLLPSI